jgi:hypothetical protein
MRLHTPHARRWLLAAFAALLVAAFVIAAPGVASAAGKAAFTLAPAAGQDSAAHGYFVLALAPGRSSRQFVVARNDSAKPITVELAAIDTSTTPVGGVAYLLSGPPLTQTGKWLTLGTDRLDIAPHEVRQVEVDVTVPADAQPGDYVAGISAMIPIKKAAKPKASSSNQARVQVNLQTRRVIAVQVSVPGAAEPKLEISGVRAVPMSDGMDLAIDMASVGQKFTSGSGTVDVASTGFKRDFPVGLFVPGTSIAYPIPHWQTAPKAGEYPAHVLIHYGDGGALTAEWTGSVTVADASLKGLQDRYVPPAGADEAKTPWLVYGLIGGLVVVVLIMGFALLRRRRPEAR